MYSAWSKRSTSQGSFRCHRFDVTCGRQAESQRGQRVSRAVCLFHLTALFRMSLRMVRRLRRVLLACQRGRVALAGAGTTRECSSLALARLLPNRYRTRRHDGVSQSGLVPAVSTPPAMHQQREERKWCRVSPGTAWETCSVPSYRLIVVPMCQFDPEGELWI